MTCDSNEPAICIRKQRRKAIASSANVTGGIQIRQRTEDLPLPVRVRAFALMMVFEFCYGWSWNTVDVLRPQILQSLDLSLAQAGSAYTAQSLGALIGAILFAGLADRFGRRRMLQVIVPGTALLAAAGVLVSSYPQLLAQRFALGLLLGANFPVMCAIYIGLFPPAMRAKLTAIGQGSYSVAVIALGYAYGLHSDADSWHLRLLASAIPALLLAPLIPLLVPDDRRLIAWGADDGEAASVPMKHPILELFTPALRRLTLLMFAVVSMNFFGYQAFAGWTTLYLSQERLLSAEAIGGLVTAQFAGALIGCFFWGWCCDRFGRRTGAWGFIAAAFAGYAYLYIAQDIRQLAFAGFAWGFAINASVAWAAWIVELFSDRLRSSAMSIYNWGRIVSMTAPLITGSIAEAAGLQLAMAAAIPAFGIGGLIWLMLPETLNRKR